MVALRWSRCEQDIRARRTGIVKNFPRSARQRNVLHALAAHGEIGRGVPAGESAEIADEMRLVVVAAVDSDAGPLYRSAALDHAQDALEAAHAAVILRRVAHLLAEQADEALGRDARFARQFADRAHRRHALQLP